MSAETAIAFVVGLAAVAVVFLFAFRALLDRFDQRADERDARHIEAILSLKAYLPQPPKPLQRKRAEPMGFEIMRRHRSDPPPPPGSYAEPARAELDNDGELAADLMHMVELGDAPRA